MTQALTAAPPATPTIDEIIDNFALLDDWDDRYRYLIELGRTLEPLPDGTRNDTNKVQGCASQVWLATSVADGAAGPVLTFAGDSDAHIVRGLIAILFALFFRQARAREILDRRASRCSSDWGCASISRRATLENGFRSMVERMRSDARAALAAV